MEVNFWLILSVFVYVFGHAVMFCYFEVKASLPDAKDGSGAFAYYKLVREILFDVGLLCLAYLIFPLEVFVIMTYVYPWTAGALKIMLYEAALKWALHEKKYGK